MEDKCIFPYFEVILHQPFFKIDTEKVLNCFVLFMACIVNIYIFQLKIFR